MSEHLDRCAVCNGTREEHSSVVKHMFTMNPGELRLPPATRDQPRQAPDFSLVAVSRLIEILVDQGTITHEEALSCYMIAKPVMTDEPKN